MSKRLTLLAAVLVTVLIPMVARAQQAPAQTQNSEKPQVWNLDPPGRAAYADKKQSAPAPVRDLSGIWNANAEGGHQAKGVKEYVDDPAHVGHDVPYSAEGKAARLRNHPAEGEAGEQFAAGDTDDPVDSCDPQGFPRMEFYEFAVVELAQAKNQVIFMNQFQDQWRVIWTDGRELPKNPDLRWNGYSVGHWEDNYTFVAETIGMDDRTWLDNVGRPHSDAMRVEERYHRVDFDHLELTVTINDPKYYTQPWVALNKYVLHRLPDYFDMHEYLCSALEVEAYKKAVATPAAANPASDKKK
jgi:hypothetical protein